MSAYGAIAAPANAAPLPILDFQLPSPELKLVTYPVHGSDAPEELIKYLYEVFKAELEGGRTYPQEGPLTYEAFVSYFFGSTTIVGIVQPSDHEIKEDLEGARAGRKWEECVGGCYYIKPNYPGRSSHTLKLIHPLRAERWIPRPPVVRGQKLGLNLGRSYLVYGPKLGYRGSVFNLVYKNNVASLAIWDQLGFTRVGIIPGAGRLKTGPNGTEEYVDAVVVFKSFV